MSPFLSCIDEHILTFCWWDWSKASKCCFVNQQYYNNKFYNHIQQSLILCLVYTNYNLSHQELFLKKRVRKISIVSKPTVHKQDIHLYEYDSTARFHQKKKNDSTARCLGQQLHWK